MAVAVGLSEEEARLRAAEVLFARWIQLIPAIVAVFMSVNTVIVAIDARLLTRADLWPASSPRPTREPASWAGGTGAPRRGAATPGRAVLPRRGASEHGAR